MARSGSPRRLPATRRETPAATEEQARVFLAAARGHRLEAWFVLAVALGPRAGELLGLRWEDLDLDGGELRVRRTYRTRGAAEERQAQPKTGEERDADLTPLAAWALRAHRWRLGNPREGWVFPGPRGEPWGRSTVRRDFERLCTAAGVPRLTMHQLRHSCASLAIDGGLNVTEVAELLGHADLSVTARVYAHAFRKARSRAAEVMARVLED